MLCDFELIKSKLDVLRMLKTINSCYIMQMQIFIKSTY